MRKKTNSKARAKRKLSHYVNPYRVTTSVSFLKGHLDHLKRRARVEKRSVNYLVNELIRQDLEAAQPTITPESVIE